MIFSKLQPIGICRKLSISKFRLHRFGDFTSNHLLCKNVKKSVKMATESYLEQSGEVSPYRLYFHFSFSSAFLSSKYFHHNFLKELFAKICFVDKIQIGAFCCFGRESRQKFRVNAKNAWV